MQDASRPAKAPCHLRDRRCSQGRSVWRGGGALHRESPGEGPERTDPDCGGPCKRFVPLDSLRLPLGAAAPSPAGRVQPEGACGRGPQDQKARLCRGTGFLPAAGRKQGRILLSGCRKFLTSFLASPRQTDSTAARRCAVFDWGDESRPVSAGPGSAFR